MTDTTTAKAEEATSISSSSDNQKKRQYAYISTGSYHDYYKHRNKDIQQRLDYFKNEWFINKRCLDVGCNEGLLTNRIAELMSPAYMLGIDIDTHVIEAANSIMKRVKYDLKKQYNSNSNSTTLSTSSSSNTIIVKDNSSKVVLHNTSSLLFVPRVMVPRVTAVTKQKTLKLNSASTNTTTITTITTTSCSTATTMNTIEYPENIEFECTSISQLSNRFHANTNQYLFDTILCLSVSKWIHLNEGDVGLLHLFQSFYDLCVPGGRVIFEYQPWKSYQNKRNVCEKTKKIFQTIKIRPDQFEDVLVSQFGFAIECKLGPSLLHAQGYNRPILVLVKRPKPMMILKSSVSSDHVVAAAVNCPNNVNVSLNDSDNSQISAYLNNGNINNDDDSRVENNVGGDVDLLMNENYDGGSSSSRSSVYGNLNTRNRTMRRERIHVSKFIGIRD